MAMATSSHEEPLQTDHEDEDGPLSVSKLEVRN